MNANALVFRSLACLLGAGMLIAGLIGIVKKGLWKF
jgi:hypothetical protein